MLAPKKAICGTFGITGLRILHAVNDGNGATRLHEYHCVDYEDLVNVGRISESLGLRIGEPMLTRRDRLMLLHFEKGNRRRSWARKTEFQTG